MTAEPSTRTARHLVRSLVEQGVTDVVLAPGSRSAPLAYALLAAEEAGWLHLHVRVDERVAGFVAVGLCRAGAGPVAVVTTSGTAVANLHPAVLEASHAGLPLILLTADRPHEMRGTGANQTTDQVRIFGTAVRHAVDVPAGAAGAALEQVVVRALAAARGLRTNDPGPVHLDVALRDPLAPDRPWQPGPRPARRTVVPAPAPPSPVPLGQGPRTVVVAGDGAGPAARDLAERAGWPLLAEPSSGARGGPAAVGPYRLLLADLGAEVERVVVLGRPTLSRPVSALLARPDVEVVVVAPSGTWPDVAGTASAVLPAVGAPRTAARADGRAWSHRWRVAADAAARVLDAALAGERVDGLRLARLVAAAPGAPVLVAGSSNAVRDLDLAGPTWPEGGGPRIIANRGLAGIDGTIATATGVALGTGEPVRALVGDLTLLHDAGALARGRHERDVDLQVVVLDDGGGGIFATLEHGDPSRAGQFERIFGTPQDVDLEALAAGYRARYHEAPTAAEVGAVLASPVRGRSLVRVPVDRSGLRADRRRLADEVSAAVRGALAG